MSSPDKEWTFLISFVHTLQTKTKTHVRTAAVLVLCIRAVRDAVTAQHGGEAGVVQTLEMSNRTAVLRRKSAGCHRGTKLFIGPVGTVQLSVTPPTLRDTLIGVQTLVLAHTTGQRLGSHQS